MSNWMPHGRGRGTEQFPDNLPPVDIDANGVVSTREPAAAQALPAADSPPAADKPLPRPLSTGVLSVLLQMQDGSAH